MERAKAQGEHPFFQGVEQRTLQLLRWNRRRKIRKKDRVQKRGFLKDWGYALISALIIVVLIWHYLFQLYVIPSGSMEQTLLVGDRVFVGKSYYGPGIFPGWNSGPQLPAWQDPQLDDVITFRSPSYESPGFLKNIFQKTIFILSLTTVNLQVDEEGNPLSEFFVKRVVATSGDTVRFRDGRMEILPGGMTEFVKESTLRELMGRDNPIQYLYTESAVKKSAPEFAEVYSYLAFRIPELIQVEGSSSLTVAADRYSAYAEVAEFFYRLNPQRTITPRNHTAPSGLQSPQWVEEVMDWHWYHMGIYIPQGYLLPLGDNRHNSLDGRFFGPRKKSEIIGITRYVLTPSLRKVY